MATANAIDTIRRDGVTEALSKGGVRFPTSVAIPYEMVLHRLSPAHDFVRITPAGETWVAANGSTGDVYHFPRCPHAGQYRQVSQGYADNMISKYTLEGVVEIEPDDTVVDAGAFVGAFTRGAASTAARVLAIEPSPATLHALKLNTSRLSNVTAIHGALWSESKPLQLRLGADASDHSLIDVDDEATGRRVPVPADRLDALASERGLDEIDFLKLDAEGAEPEVLAGTSGIGIRKLAVDSRPERRGTSTVEDVRTILEDRGYATATDDGIVFARQRS
ncbi:FkbM family methyltransferase [Natrinema salsiterrestre]|uniref:FkbM family methyltransferase n=1 Tax=Natrinema salsiterrestre TaxID=2950540 RepID=A0A9Q4L068_9EURY|nr:FkbM family methyltransferase [Natrinema salsiterrestre]MDF9743997.1 FkbM family methyltransferase [Natrinema salsiterrestre]